MILCSLYFKHFHKLTKYSNKSQVSSKTMKYSIIFFWYYTIKTRKLFGSFESNLQCLTSTSLECSKNVIHTIFIVDSSRKHKKLYGNAKFMIFHFFQMCIKLFTFHFFRYKILSKENEILNYC